VGERNLPRLSRRCYGLRKPGRKLKSRKLLGARFLPRRVHVIQQDLLVPEEAANQVDWRTTVVADPVWETDILPGDGGRNTSLAKREC
jgi:hypothetical protein